ncbi:leucine-rich repeat domain-containing protein [Capnocytophaga cynodegmi]|uniref:leucine-rich repeat domain-containing protein n=1 Tax=Capnocytophaga cynodegmi TaxID=28189 RepID=UPI00385D8C36
MKKILIMAFVLMTISMAYAQKETDIVYIPDENFKRILLENEEINTNGDEEISYKEAKNYTGIIDASDDYIKSLEGIEAFVNITMLDCAYNELTSLDLSKNVNLEILNCVYNQLTSLDISKNTSLKILNCYSNQLTRLDVSKNTNLEQLDCSSNEFTKLNLANGNNEKIYYMLVDKNPDLKCIQIDKYFTPPAPVYYKDGGIKDGWLKDEDAKYNDTCK